MNRGIQFDIESHSSRTRMARRHRALHDISLFDSVSHIKPYTQEIFNLEFRGIQHVKKVNIEQKMRWSNYFISFTWTSRVTRWSIDIPIYFGLQREGNSYENMFTWNYKTISLRICQSNNTFIK